MYSSGNRAQKTFRLVLDIISTLLGVSVIVLTIIAFNQEEDYVKIFPYLFLCGGLMNLLGAIKNFITNRKASGITMSITTVIFFVASILSFISLK